MLKPSKVFRYPPIRWYVVHAWFYNKKTQVELLRQNEQRLSCYTWSLATNKPFLLKKEKSISAADDEWVFGVSVCLNCYASQKKMQYTHNKDLSLFNSLVQELTYHLELARGCYKGSAIRLAWYSMLRKRNVIKFVKDSSILRPGYYIGVDPRAKLVILGIRWTHTVYDLVTDLIALSDLVVSPRGFSGHFGTYEPLPVGTFTMSSK
jgi:hypothetical protein